MNLSSPEGYSVNYGIDKEGCSFHYILVDVAATQITELGQGMLLAKMDIKQAYRNIPVAPQDRHLLGFRWKEKVYIEKVLPFGLRSSPLIFSATADGCTAVGDATKWCVLGNTLCGRFSDHWKTWVGRMLRNMAGYNS